MEVSVVIPSKDNVTVLTKCLETLCQTVRRTRYEIIVVDNGSKEKAKIKRWSLWVGPRMILVTPAC